MKRKGILLVYLLLMSILLRGQNVKVISEFDTSRIFIGDQINYYIKIEKPSESRLSLPLFKDTLIKEIEIVSGPLIDSTTQAGRTIIIQKYLITSFDSGRYQLPPVYAEMKSASGIQRFFSDYALLEVLRVNIPPADTSASIYDIIAPYKAPVSAGEILPWVLLLAAISIIAWFLYKYLKNRKKKEVADIMPVKVDPAHITAFRELERLKEEQLWQKGEVKEYYSRLTEIIRQYLEERYGIMSLELTSSETLNELLKTGFPKDDTFRILKDVLSTSDLVKFAKFTPEPSDNDKYFQLSWDFVVITKKSENQEVIANIAGEDKK